MSQRKFAIVTGASSGIGLELARLAAAPSGMLAGQHRRMTEPGTAGERTRAPG